MSEHQVGLYEQAQQLAQTGQGEMALGCMLEYLKINPRDSKALNDAGAILYSLGRLDEAQKYLEDAKAVCADSAEILWNLGEVYLSQHKPLETSSLFGAMEKQGILNIDLVNRTAKEFIDLEDKANAVEMLLKSLEIAPNQELLKPMLDVIRSKRPKIAFFCFDNDMKFMGDILAYAKKRYPVEVYQGNSAEKMYSLMKWSDISWFEWCTDGAIQASRLPKVCRNIIRLHRWEAYQDFPRQVNWENIDVLLTVGNSYVMKSIKEQVPNLECMSKVLTIPNGLDLEKIKFIERRRGKNLACIGYINLRKNPMFLLQCLQKLHYIDREYKLYFAGDFQDKMLEQYVRHMVKAMELQDVAIFDGWQSDISKWLEDKHYIVTATLGESQGMGVLEGMASGLKPVIHNFPGASEIFPSEFLFNISEEFCRQVLSDSYDPWRYREFVAARYPLNSQIASINDIFTHFESLPLKGNREVDLCRERLVPFCSGKGIDIGCGDNKILAEAIGVDIRPGVADITADAGKLPFENESMDYVFSSHCLEDMEDTGGTLAEWMRILKPGGNLILYLPHWNFYPRVGQPGANPHHKYNFYPDRVLAALSETCDYEILHLNEVGNAGEHSFEIVVKKLPTKIATRKVLVEYHAAVGDILCMEPAVRALKQKLGNEVALTVRVTHPELFRNHPAIARVENTTFPYRDKDYEQHFILNYKRTPENANMHLVDRSAGQIQIGLENVDRCPKIYLDNYDEQMLRKFQIPAGKPRIVIASGVRWPSRSWSMSKWQQLCTRFEKELKAQIIQLGGEGEKSCGIGIDLSGRTTIREAASIMHNSDLVISTDTGLAHVAAAVGAPRVVLFGPVDPAARMHPGPGTAVTAKNNQCHGCFHWSDQNVSMCPKGNNACMELISVDDVFAAAQERLQKGRNG